MLQDALYEMVADHECLSFHSDWLFWKKFTANLKSFTAPISYGRYAVKWESTLWNITTNYWYLLFIKHKTGLVFNETLVSESLDDAKSETRYLSKFLKCSFKPFKADLSDEYGRVWLLANARSIAIYFFAVQWFYAGMFWYRTMLEFQQCIELLKDRIWRKPLAQAKCFCWSILRSGKSRHNPKQPWRFLSFKIRPECIDAMTKTQLQGDFYESIFGNLNPCGNMSLPKIQNEHDQQMFYFFVRNYVLEEAVLVSKIWNS